MPTDLVQKAKDAKDVLDAELTEMNDLVTKLRTDVDHTFVELPNKKRSDLTREELATSCGAREHVDLARALLVASEQRQEEIRADLAAVASPADVDRLEGDLRAELVEAAALRVELREAEERLAAATTKISVLSRLVAGATQRRSVLADREVWATERVERVDALRGAVPATTSEGTSVRQVAVDALGGDPFDDAEGRLQALLPQDLLDRALARRAEAVARERDAVEHLTELEALERSDAEAAAPRARTPEHRREDLAAAEAALAAHVSGSADLAAWALAALAAVAVHPDLSATQVAAIDDDEHAIGVEGTDREGELAAALTAFDQAARDVARERIVALAADPTATADTVDAWGDAEGLLESAAITGALDDARDEYTDARRVALDAWEVEVPDSLWEAVASFSAAKETLEELADADTADDLVAALDDAEAALADAWDDEAAAAASARLLARERADRQAMLDSIVATTTRRERQFVRGDAAGGRTRRELGLEPDLVGGA